MKKIKLIATAAFLLTCYLQVCAQLINEDSVWAEALDSCIAVHYSLIAEQPIHLKLQFSTDDGRTWRDCKKVTGDLKSQKTGEKTIIWNLKQEGWEKGNFWFQVIFEQKYIKAIEEQKAKAEKAKADSIAKAEKARADSINVEKLLAKQELRNERRLANQNLNGHYITLGSSLLSSGYYGGYAGLGYEYRYHILGVNASVGYGYDWRHDDTGSVRANAGFKLYWAYKTTLLRNLYFNFLPFSYFGQKEESYYSANGSSINKISKDPHLYGVGLFFGYAPVWYVNKNISVGMNIDVGMKTNYAFKKWRGINWDLGVVVKIKN